jgi:hypothetical protein
MTLLRDLMLADLERGLAHGARDGHEVVPAWRILAPDGDFLILTQFDPDKPEQRERAFCPPRHSALTSATIYTSFAGRDAAQRNGHGRGHSLRQRL